jgi:hypothetical protein
MSDFTASRHRGATPRRLWVRVAVGASLLAGTPAIALAKTKHRGGGASAEAAAAPAASPEPVAPPPAATTPPPAAAPAAVPAAPSAVAAGRVSFGAAGPGQGRVTVKGDNLQITFDGRPFGVSPLTIHDVPRGDYVVEGTTADGRHLSRPVTVEENGDAVVELKAGLFGAPEQAGGGDGSFRLPLASKVLLGLSAGALTVGAVFGVLEMKAHSDYESAATQSALDQAAHAGTRDALIANIGFATCGASLLASGLVALPAFLRSERPASVPTAVVVSSRGHTLAIAGVSVAF